MTKRYFGGLMSNTRITTSVSSANGIFSLTDQLTNSGSWPLASVNRVLASATYNAQGWVSGSTDYVGTTGAFSFSIGQLQASSGGARTIPLPYGSSTTKVYFEILLSSVGGAEALIGIAGDANSGGYNNFPCLYLFNGNGYGGYTGSVTGPYVNGDVFRIAYDAAAGRVFYGRNNSWAVDPVSGTGTTIPNVTRGSLSPRVIIVSGSSSGATISGTFRWASSSFTYAIPSGYVALGISL